MVAKLWVLSKLFPKLAGLIISSGPVIRASRAFLASLRKGYEDVSDEKLKAHLVEFELRIEKLEAALAGVDKTLRRLAGAVYLVAGVAIAALILAIVKLA